MLDRTVANHLADTWWARLCDISSTAGPEHRERLDTFVIELARCLCTHPFTVAPAMAVGAALTDLSTDPAVIGASAAALIDLPAQLPGPEPDTTPQRFPLVIAALAQGFTEAIRHELYRQARHDPLTTLPNRLYLGEMLNEAVETSGPNGRIGMCYLDLDGFKAVNDHYGHGAGDQVLIAVARNLREAADDMVSVVARLGGDEFVALVTPPVVQERLVAVSRALLDAVARPIVVGEHQLRISASIGALSTKIGQLEARELLELADEGLYRAKADTRERICMRYHPSQEFRSPVR